jgi:hypothetical protein
VREGLEALERRFDASRFQYSLPERASVVYRGSQTMATITNPRRNGLARVTMLQRLGRTIAGFFLGWVWSSVIGLACLGVAAVGYGGLDRALNEMRNEPWIEIAFAGYFGAAIGSWTGGTIGPLTLGPCRLQRPILTSSFLGGMAGAVLAAASGCLIGWLGWEPTPNTTLLLQPPCIFGIVLGALTGCAAGRWLTRGRDVLVHHE